MTALALLLLLISRQIPQTPPQTSTRFAIAGVVVDAVTGTPVPRAEVSIFVETDELKITGADNGRLQFQNLPPGKYPLFAEAHGYVRESLDQHGPYATAVAVGTGLDSEH